MAYLHAYPCLNPTIDRLRQLQLDEFMKFSHDWNKELIMQFYATMFIPGIDEALENWTLQWMTRIQVYKVSSATFIQRISLTCEPEAPKLHL